MKARRLKVKIKQELKNSKAGKEKTKVNKQVKKKRKIVRRKSN
jgi:hypothetical protein